MDPKEVLGMVYPCCCQPELGGGEEPDEEEDERAADGIHSVRL